MAFDFNILGRYPCPPAQKRLTEAFRLERVWGDFTNGGSDTGGAIIPECDNVLFAQAIDESGANAIQIQLDTPSAGQFTITTTADHDGRWEALVAHRKK